MGSGHKHNRFTHWAGIAGLALSTLHWLTHIAPIAMWLGVS